MEDIPTILENLKLSLFDSIKIAKTISEKYTVKPNDKQDDELYNLINSFAQDLINYEITLKIDFRFDEFYNILSRSFNNKKYEINIDLRNFIQTYNEFIGTNFSRKYDEYLMASLMSYNNSFHNQISKSKIRHYESHVSTDIQDNEYQKKVDFLNDKILLLSSEKNRTLMIRCFLDLRAMLIHICGLLEKLYKFLQTDTKTIIDCCYETCDLSQLHLLNGTSDTHKLLYC